MKITHFNPPMIVPDDVAPEYDQSVAVYHHHYLHGEKIRWQELEKFGYRHTARHIAIGSDYKLFELLPIGSAYHAPKSFLAPNHRQSGVIISGAFFEHKAVVNPLTARARSAGTGARKSRAIGTSPKDGDEAPPKVNLA